MNRLFFLIVLMLLILTPLPYGSTESWAVALWELIIFATMIVWAIYSLIKGHIIFQFNPLLLPLAALLITAFIQIATISYDPYTTFQAVMKISAYLCFFLLFTTFVSTIRRVDLTIRVIVALCILIALIGIGQSYTGRIIWEYASFGPFVNRNHFAGFLEMGIALAGGIIVTGIVKREILALYISAIIIMSAGIVLSGSRGGMLSLIGEIIFIITLTIPTLIPKKFKPKKLKMAPPLGIATAGLAIIILALFIAGSEDLIRNINQTKNETSQNVPLSERYNRIELWKTTGEIINDHPWLGVGLGAYPTTYTRYDRSSGTQRVEQSHNDYLQIAADAGITGIIIAISFLIILFVYGYKASQSHNKHKRAIAIGALAGCFAIIIHSVVEFNLQITSNGQLFLALAGLATMRSNKES